MENDPLRDANLDLGARNKQDKNQKLTSHEIKGGQVRNGMDVLGKDGNKIGTVDGIVGNGFKVDRSSDRDVYVPFDRAHEENGKVMLDVRIDEVEDQNWDMPEYFE